jgi:lipid-binding SYLF domain-containing protein
MWQRAKAGGRASLDRFWGWSSPLTSSESQKKFDSQALWPTTLDKECDKAARILRSFCKDGFQVDNPSTVPEVSKQVHGTIRRLPEEVIRNAKGLAIFTIMRTGLWVNGAGGSGVLISKLPSGSWSPPSAILLHTDGVAFLLEVDMYDCVLVLNTEDAMNALSQDRYSIGSGISTVSGPVVSGEFPDSDIFGIPAPIYTYVKAQGTLSEAQLLGAIVVERADENERFYRRKITASEILTGKVTRAPPEINRLIHTTKASQGDTDVDPLMLPIEAAPSDMDLADGRVFGVPNKDDPDPFGFLALEKEGLMVREAGSLKRASVESFNFKPGPNSPLFNAFNRGSGDATNSPRSSWRTSVTERSMQTMDMATQTDSDISQPASRPQSVTFRASMASISEAELPSIDQKLKVDQISQGLQANASVETLHMHIRTPTAPEITTQAKMMDEPFVEQDTISPVETPVSPVINPVADSTSGDQPSSAFEKDNPPVSPLDPEPTTMVDEGIQANQTEDSDADDEDADEDETMVIQEVIQTAAPRIITASPQIITKARLVTVNKLPPAPALPARNPIRNIVPRTPSPSSIGFKSMSPSFSEGRTETAPRPTSSGGSSTYSLKKDEMPISAGATDSLGSISSVDDSELARITPGYGSIQIHDNKNCESLTAIGRNAEGSTVDVTEEKKV